MHAIYSTSSTGCAYCIHVPTVVLVVLSSSQNTAVLGGRMNLQPTGNLPVYGTNDVALFPVDCVDL
jgi:hypothetical protein